MAKQEKELEFIKGAAVHRRTEGDYMSTLLDAVSLDDWRDVVLGTLALAKEGDPSARAWLAQYLVGKPNTQAPTPLTVVVNRLSNQDPLVEKLAKPFIDQELYPLLTENEDFKGSVRVLVAAELNEKLPAAEPAVMPI